jgi:Secretion system C-terminal sorting domain
LKINDLDGTFAYSEAKTILFNKDASKIVAEVYPNPSYVSIQLKINGGVQSDLMTEVVVNDYLGRQVLSINQQLAVDSIVDLNLEGKAMGVYIVIIRNGNSSLVQKVVIQ